MITPIGMVHTPSDWDEIFAWINLHSPSDRPHLITAAGMSWNLAAQLIQKKETQDA
jgi:hypothetical protein|tara:strand:+ start:484 stop:651 length:168 start_codon:yes stop_codon:yes gene_type:complete